MDAFHRGRRTIRWLFRSGLVSLATLGGLVTILCVGLVLFWNITDHSIVIEPMSVSKELADDGYSPAVAAQKLHDAINEIVVRARSTRRHESVKLSAEIPDFVVPTIGMSASTVVRRILAPFHLSTQRTISGEFTSRAGCHALAIRLNGDVVFANGAGLDPRDPDALIAAAARAVLGRTQPFLLAAAEPDPRTALRQIDSIIARLPQNDDNVREAYNLRGAKFLKMKERGLAKAAYRRCAELYPDFAVPHYNLGNLLLDEHLYEKAILEYGRAIDLDRHYHRPYNGLGDAFAAEGKPEEAIGAYRKAIRMEPSDPEPHDSLGELFRDLRRLDEAIAELSIASKLDPHDPDIGAFNTNLGIVLKEDGRTDDAISAFRNALANEPSNADAAYRLALALSDDALAAPPGRIAAVNLRDACSALAGISDPARRSAAEALRIRIDAKLRRMHDRCVPAAPKKRRTPRKTGCVLSPGRSSSAGRGPASRRFRRRARTA
jgi:tetratricopeptide (TPR) repeat protein